jgi:probable phosphomutase (TIGR03848 family)
MTMFLLIRHGMTDAVGHNMTGRSPGVELNATGKAQIQTLSDRMGPMQIDAIYASPLERTRDTANALARARGMEVQFDDRLIEIDYGQWTGRRFADMADDPAWQLYNAVRSVTRPPGGDSLLDIQHRAVNALIDYRTRHSTGVVAVVSHADTLRAMLLYFLGMPIDFVLRLELSPARISVLQIGDGPPRLLQVNGDTVPAAG